MMRSSYLSRPCESRWRSFIMSEYGTSSRSIALRIEIAPCQAARLHRVGLGIGVPLAQPLDLPTAGDDVAIARAQASLGLAPGRVGARRGGRGEPGVDVADLSQRSAPGGGAAPGSSGSRRFAWRPVARGGWCLRGAPSGA